MPAPHLTPSIFPVSKYYFEKHRDRHLRDIAASREAEFRDRKNRINESERERKHERLNAENSRYVTQVTLICWKHE